MLKKEEGKNPKKETQGFLNVMIATFPGVLKTKQN